MTEHVSAKALEPATLANLVSTISAEEVRKVLSVIERDRVLVGCIGTYAVHKDTGSR